jgi:hypothetical protein
LNQASHKMAEDLYKAQAAGPQAGPQPGAGPQGGAQSGGPSMKNAEDADYEVVDDEEKKK